MPIPRRCRFIIEPLDHEKGGSTGAPPIFERHVPAGREMRDKDRRPAFDLFQYLGVGCWREPARPQHGDAIAAIHLGLRRIAKCVPIGPVGGAMRPPAASSVTLRTSD